MLCCCCARSWWWDGGTINCCIYTCARSPTTRCCHMLVRCPSARLLSGPAELVAVQLLGGCWRLPPCSPLHSDPLGHSCGSCSLLACSCSYASLFLCILEAAPVILCRCVFVLFQCLSLFCMISLCCFFVPFFMSFSSCSFVPLSVPFSSVVAFQKSRTVWGQASVLRASFATISLYVSASSAVARSARAWRLLCCLQLSDGCCLSEVLYACRSNLMVCLSCFY